jgi:thiamine monophosphate kinase
VEDVARATGRDPRELTVSGGEDYELLVALPAGAQERAGAALRPLGLGLTVIGEAYAGEAVEFSSHGAAYRPAAGFDQLRPPPGPDDRA